MPMTAIGTPYPRDAYVDTNVFLYAVIRSSTV